MTVSGTHINTATCHSISSVNEWRHINARFIAHIFIFWKCKRLSQKYAYAYVAQNNTILQFQQRKTLTK